MENCSNPSYFEVEACDGGCRVKKYTGPNEATVVIPSCIDGNKVVEIGESAFEYCTGLTSVTIPDSVTDIGGYAFLNCIGLTGITIPNGVTKIGRNAFEYCTGLTSVTIPDSVAEIGDNAFSDCESLTSMTILNSVTDIGRFAFAYCNKLIIHAPTGSAAERYAEVSGIPFQPLAQAPAARVKLQETDSSYFEVEACDGGCRIKKYTGLNEGAVVIPSCIGGSKVVEIGSEAFIECKSLTSVVIPDGVTEIGNHAFAFCTSLASVTIPDSIVTINMGAFTCCEGLTSMIIPDSVTEIGSRRPIRLILR